MECDVNLFAKMYEAVYRDLYRFALCMMRDAHDAEDSVSEAVISAYENIKKLRSQEAFKSWMFTILANVCKKKLSRKGKEKAAILEETAFFEESARELDYGIALDVRQAFFVLSEEEQMVVGLSVFGGYDSREIGDMLKLNASTVRSKRKRALEKMHCILK